MPYHIRIKTKSNPYVDEVALDLTEQKLRERFIDPYNRGSAIVTEGRTIALQDIIRISIRYTNEQATPFVEASSHISRMSRKYHTDWEWLEMMGARDVTEEFITAPPGNFIGKIEQREKRDSLFLQKLCDMVDGNELERILTSKIADEIAEQLGFDRFSARDSAQRLANKGLIKVEGRETYDNWLISITPSGVQKVKADLSEPDKPTEHFPPASIIYVGGNMVDSQIQQASPEATQTVTISANKLEDLKEVVELPKISIDNLNLEFREDSVKFHFRREGKIWVQD